MPGSLGQVIRPSSAAIAEAAGIVAGPVIDAVLVTAGNNSGWLVSGFVYAAARASARTIFKLIL